MAIIAMPAKPVASKIEWIIDEPAEVNRSEWTNRRKVAILPAAPRWFAQVTMPTIVGEDAILPWRSFLAQLRGQANTFRLVACETTQITGVAPQVKGAAQFGYGLHTDGWGAAGHKLSAGQFVTLNEQLLQLAADVVADSGGNADLTFGTWMRQIPADNTGLIVDRPTALMAMSKGQNGWSVAPGQQYSVSFACEEAF